MNELRRLIEGIFAPPYSLLPLAVFGFFVLCFALHPASPLFTHHLSDPDDYMRLNETASWIKGQSWYDLSVPRLSPGAGTVVHWARLLDVPIAVIALPFVAFFGVTHAVMISGLIVPLLWFAVLLGLLPALARPIVGAERANLAGVMVLFAPMLLFNYTPGRVDHHGIQAIIAGFGLLSFYNIVAGIKPRLFAALAALCFACGFWIGAEALPWVILFIACLGIAAATQGERVARDAAFFGLCLPVFTACLIPIALPAAEFLSRALSWFSPAYVLFAALSGSILIAGWLLSFIPSPLWGGLGRGRRLLIYALLALAAAYVFFALIPAALHGPYSDYDAFDATTALDNIHEAQPLYHAFAFNRFMPMTILTAFVAFIRLVLLPLIAIKFCAEKTADARGETRMIWFAQLVFLTAATALTVFWQMRVGLFMELFAIAPLTALMSGWWDRLSWGLWDRPLFLAQAGVFLLVGFVPAILLPALITPTPLYPDIVLFPAMRDRPRCDLGPLIPSLDDSDGLGAKPLTIMNISDNGPQLLFETPHRVVSGNFDVPGNADAARFFSATDDKAAQAAAARWNPDLVVLCRNVPPLYLGAHYNDPGHRQLHIGADGLLHYTNTDAAQPLAARLVRGDIPAWLKPVEIPAPSNYLVFQVLHAAPDRRNRSPDQAK